MLSWGVHTATRINCRLPTHLIRLCRPFQPAHALQQVLRCLCHRSQVCDVWQAEGMGADTCMCLHLGNATSRLAGQVCDDAWQMAGIKWTGKPLIVTIQGLEVHFFHTGSTTATSAHCQPVSNDWCAAHAAYTAQVAGQPPQLTRNDKGRRPQPQRLQLAERLERVVEAAVPAIQAPIAT